MSATAIEWTDETWNPVTGCDRVSPGCAHCYALELAPRLRAMGLRKYIGARDGGRASGPAFGVTMHPSTLDEPLRWRRPRRVFVNSMSDLFHDEVPDGYVASIFAVMAQASQHVFQVLTKRPERMRELLSSPEFIVDVVRRLPADHLLPLDWPLANVWLGATIENRQFVDRADVRRATPAAVRFISAEPLLGPLVYDGEMWDDGAVFVSWKDGHRSPDLDLSAIDWLIVGGESGAEHRRIDPNWVRDLRVAAEAAGTAFFFKQWGGRTPKAGGRELDGRTYDEIPEVRRVVAA